MPGWVLVWCCRMTLLGLVLLVRVDPIRQFIGKRDPVVVRHQPCGNAGAWLIVLEACPELCEVSSLAFPYSCQGHLGMGFEGVKAGD